MTLLKASSLVRCALVVLSGCGQAPPPKDPARTAALSAPVLRERSPATSTP
jgi:hypothetical protein